MCGIGSNPGRDKVVFLSQSVYFGSYSVDTGVPLWEQSGRGVGITAHLHRIPILRTSPAKLYPFLYAPMGLSETTLPFLYNRGYYTLQAWSSHVTENGVTYVSRELEKWTVYLQTTYRKWGRQFLDTCSKDNQAKDKKSILNIKVKVNFTLEQTSKAQRGSRGIALLFL